MKFFILFLILCTQATLAQVRHGTTTEEVIGKGFYDWAYLHHDDVGLCSLPMVTRGDAGALVKHDLIVETVMDHVTEATERIYLKTDDQFEYDDCISHKQKISTSLHERGGQIPVTLYYTDKLITDRGSYMGMSFCQKELIRTIEATINKVRYYKTMKISDEVCK